MNDHVIPEAQPGAPAFDPALRARLAERLSSMGPEYTPRTRNLRGDGSPLYSNRLLLESSPYLQQHAHNPVNWYPWGDEAFEAARALGRPVLLSIGYSTCHWCHVMEEESFDDPDTAAYLNAHYIAIKVDREARPDVDNIYMAAVHALGIRGGWPLNVFLTPDRRAFYGGTYFPDRPRGRHPSFLQVLQSIKTEYGVDPTRIEEQAAAITTHIQKSLAGATASTSQAPDASALGKVVGYYARAADREWGGIGIAPKFPSSMPVRLLLRYARRTGDREARELATLTLERMADGGIHDQVGGGFHRYSTDQRWLVPHFEKMLYDNALLAQDYLEAWQLTGRDDFAGVVRKLLSYVQREMTSPEGAFYSATDADSVRPDGESEEGWFFTWTPAELDATLGRARAKEVTAYYGVSAQGNFEGRSILHVRRSAETVAAELGITSELLLANLAESREKLYAERAKRRPPLRDDKILVAWNGLMISAFARAGFALDEPAFTRSAERAARFVLDHMRNDGRFHRVYKDGRAAGPSFLEDYAFFVQALLDLYEAQPDPRWLENALALQQILDEHYLDTTGGGYFKTADDGEALLVREKPGSDGAVPSGNSITARNLLRLHEYTAQARYADQANMLFSVFFDELSKGSPGMSEMFLALDFALDSPKEIVIVSPPGAGDLAAMLAPLRRSFVPNRIVSIVTEGKDLDAHARLSPLVEHKRALDGRVTAYVCEDRVCASPAKTPEEFEKQITRIAKIER